MPLQVDKIALLFFYLKTFIVNRRLSTISGKVSYYIWLDICKKADS